ncbi:MAG: Gfo/Idh/MocA family oxidoreductase [Oscillospiraceae bacterium]
MKKIWKVALVGCGSIAESIYIPQMRHFPNVELVAVCDILPERAKDYAERFHVPNWYGSIEELLEKCDFEILMDTASIPAHHELNMKALKAGKHLYSQKPIAPTVEQVDEQIRAAKEAGVVFAASPIHPLRPDILRIRKLIKEGLIGKPTMIRVHTAHGGPEYFQHREVDPSWFFEPGAGALYDMGVHGITMATAVLGPAKEVSCVAEISEPHRVVRTGAFDGKVLDSNKLPDNYLITLNWGDGCIGIVDAGFCQKASTVNMLEVYGTLGTLTILGQIKIGEGDGIKAYLDIPEKHVHGWMDIKTEEKPRGEFDQCECLLDIIAAIESGEEVKLRPEIARHVVDIMCTIPKAIAEKRTLPLHTTF